MAFLRINGIDVPVFGEGTSGSAIDIGERIRSFDGTLLTNRIARKREWQMETPVVKELYAAAYDGLIAGLGDSFPFGFQEASNLTGDLFSSKGQAPGSTAGSIYFGKGADGNVVTDDNGEDESKFQNGSLCIEAAVTNILNSEYRDMEEGTGSFLALNTATIGSDTTIKLQGSNSIKVDALVATDGIETGADSAAAALTQYTASVYIYSTTAFGIDLSIAGNVSGNLTTTNITTVANEWRRFTVTGTTAAGDSFVRVRMRKSGAGAATWYIDAMQVELGAVATAFADPTRAVGDLAYSEGIVSNAKDLSFSFWIKGEAATLGSDRFFIDLSVSLAATQALAVYRPSGTTDLAFLTRSADGTTSDTLTASAVFDDLWHYVAGTIRKNPETGEVTKVLYIDGILDSSVTTASVPDFSLCNGISIGHSGGSDLMTGHRLNDLFFLPYAMPVDFITALFANTESVAILPRSTADGDFIPDSSVTVEGVVDSFEYVMASIDDTFRNNARKLEFTLQEA